MTISSEVVIGNETVDLNRPQDVVLALRKAKLRIATGEAVESQGFGDEQTTWTRSNLKDIDRLIGEYQLLADEQNPQATRKRYAKRARY